MDHLIYPLKHEGTQLNFCAFCMTALQTFVLAVILMTLTYAHTKVFTFVHIRYEDSTCAAA